MANELVTVIRKLNLGLLLCFSCELSVSVLFV